MTKYLGKELHPSVRALCDFKRYIYYFTVLLIGE